MINSFGLARRKENFKGGLLDLGGMDSNGKIFIFSEEGCTDER